MEKEAYTPNPQEAAYVGKILMAMASGISGEQTRFSSWMLASFGAGLGLLVANIANVAPFIPPSVISSAVNIFLIAVMVHVFQRYLGAMIAGSIATSKEIEAIQVTQAVNLDYVISEIKGVTLWPAVYIVRWSSRKVMAGDFAYSGRLNAKLAQVSAWLVFTQMILLVIAVSVIAKGING